MSNSAKHNRLSYASDWGVYALRFRFAPAPTPYNGARGDRSSRGRPARRGCGERRGCGRIGREPNGVRTCHGRLGRHPAAEPQRVRSRSGWLPAVRVLPHGDGHRLHPVRIVDDGRQVDRRAAARARLRIRLVWSSTGRSTRRSSTAPWSLSGSTSAAGSTPIPDWTQTHNELIRDGFAWVGVSAQAQGVNQLKCSATAPPSLQCPAPGDPVRYSSLSSSR